MKKLLLLMPLLFLCSCTNNRTLKDTYNMYVDRNDGYLYSVKMNYDNGSLELTRCSNKGGEFTTYKSYNDYEIVNDNYKSILYDYGDYAIYIGRIS